MTDSSDSICYTAFFTIEVRQICIYLRKAFLMIKSFEFRNDKLQNNSVSFYYPIGL